MRALANRYGPTRLSVAPEGPCRPDYLQYLVLGEAELGAPLSAFIGACFMGPLGSEDEWAAGMV